MSRKMKTYTLMLMVLILAAFGSFALAQDDTDDGATLESVTADTASYIGQEVTLEGVIEELVNVRAFTLGEGAALDDDKVLVVNNSGHEFDLRITAGQRIRITGIVHPNYLDNGLSEITTNLPMVTDEAPMEMTEEPMAEMTEEPMMEATDEAMMDVTAEATMEMTAEPMAEMTEEPTMEATDEAMMDVTPEATMEMTEEPMMEPTEDIGIEDDMFQMDAIDLSTMELPERLQNFTILEITSISAITFVEESE
ncbi:MAG: DUF4131 domain-containing protein [Anaerolineae bacterium]|nr:DUF4131 domain-containing protein [Anaerolineae bacterium]